MRGARNDVGDEPRGGVLGRKSEKADRRVEQEHAKGAEGKVGRINEHGGAAQGGEIKGSKGVPAAARV